MRPLRTSLPMRLGEWPLLLKLVNGALRERVNELRAPLADALSSVAKRLDKYGLGAFDSADARAREEAVAKTLGLSLDLLSVEYRARLNELAVFPEDVTIPVPTVELLWQQTAALDEIDTEDLLQRLFRLSLLLELDLAERTVRLHDVIRTWLRREIGPVRVAELDGALVAGYRARCGGAWHALPDDGYALSICHPICARSTRPPGASCCSTRAGWRTSSPRSAPLRWWLTTRPRTRTTCA